ncbi:DUF6642 family protein [Actinopolymorpha singaporensis]|uniref:CHAT domain-containing protein n=1 Tax=Actinopolymorpha singaporensis TaxID=117157 RepID=A0A1H1QXK3_9ACTN|nr:DUF6642 family protein [Actinopolymorpha singaporensis]SDS27609.1 hypothetical protein SAMN04489717_2171 [Actinopolymorpha singaporensis]
MATPRGVFCLEGQWDENLTDTSSVRPALELLERLGYIQFIHKDVATVPELDHFLERWARRAYSDFAVGYFAMHGESSKLRLSNGNVVPLHHIAQHLEGRCGGRRLYFGSCSVMNASDASLTDFLKLTGAELICGYTKDVDWLDSAAFDVAFLGHLANGTQRKLLTTAHWSAVTQKLGFRILYSDGRKNSR